MSPTQDSEKKIVLCKKGDDITRFDGTNLVTYMNIDSVMDIKNFISHHTFEKWPLCLLCPL
jgi:hypothetical protein